MYKFCITGPEKFCKTLASKNVLLAKALLEEIPISVVLNVGK
jgi:hypothetical protein